MSNWSLVAISWSSLDEETRPEDIDRLLRGILYRAPYEHPQRCCDVRWTHIAPCGVIGAPGEACEHLLVTHANNVDVEEVRKKLVHHFCQKMHGGEAAIIWKDENMTLPLVVLVFPDGDGPR